MKDSKKVGLDRVLEEIKSGLSPAQISRKYSIPKQNISYFVGKLKEKGCIEKIGYGTWRFLRALPEVKDLTTRQYDRSTLTFPKKEIRGHAFIWKIEFVKPYNWPKIVRHYNKKKLTFQLMQHNKVIRTIFKNRKIWLGKRGLTIYEPIDFLGRSSFEVKGKAVFEMDLLVKNLLKELSVPFRAYRFTTSREHYGIIKNELARQYNDKKKKMHIRSEDGAVWMWIDDSKELGELENKEPNISRQVQRFWNNHKKNDFKIDADFVLKGFNEMTKGIKKNTKNLDYHGENMSTHVGVMKNIEKNLAKQTKLFEKIAGELKEKKRKWWRFSW